MKKRVKIIIVILLVLMIAAIAVFLLKYGTAFGINIIKPSPEKYVEQAVTFMDSQGIYASGDEWEKVRSETIEKAKSAKSFDECHQLLNDALKVAGGKHSRLITSEENSNGKFELPMVEMKDNGLIYIRLPQFSGTVDEGKQYANTVYDALREHREEIQSAVVDIRDNHGGDMGPMVAAVSPLLPDGELMYFNIHGVKNAVTLEDGTVNGGGSTVSLKEPFKLNIPVAVLQNNETGSSAEVLLICFRGLENARSFGGPSAGYCSCNTTRKLYDGAVMLLTIGKDVSRTGQEFCEDPIFPEEATDSPLETALEWLSQRKR